MLACCTCDDGEVGLEEFDTARGEGTAVAAHVQRLRGESTNSEQGPLPSRATFSTSSNGRKSPSSTFSGQSSSPPGMSLQRRSRPPPLLIPDSSAAAHMMGSPSPGATGPGMGRGGSQLEGPPYAI